LKKWARILMVMLALAATVVVIVVAQDSGGRAVQVHFTGYDTNGSAGFFITNGTAHDLVINRPVIKLKEGNGWTNYYGRTVSFCGFMVSTPSGEVATRRSELLPTNVIWRATVYCEAWHKAPWKDTVNSQLRKLHLPNLFRSRIFTVTTPEYHRPALALGAPVAETDMAAALKE
jgi:hypothetical protein